MKAEQSLVLFPGFSLPSHLLTCVPGMSIEMQRKINHLTQILNAVLPSSHSSGHVSKLQELLSVYEEDAGPRAIALSLRNIRLASLELGACPHAWREPVVPAYKYSVGDLGYLAEKGDFSSFHLICNVIQDGRGSVPLVHAQYGSQSQWYTTGQTTLDPFPCPGDKQGFVMRLTHPCNLALNSSDQVGGRNRAE